MAGCIFAGGIIGLHLHRVLPKAHLTKDVLDVIKLGTGMLSVLASLVLGLLPDGLMTVCRDAVIKALAT